MVYGNIPLVNKKNSRVNKLIVYDLDGTLIDSRRDISDAVNWTLKELGLSSVPSEQISTFIGSGVKNLMQQTLIHVGAGLPALTQATTRVAPTLLDRSIKLFRRRYGEHLLDQTCLYPSVPKVLEFFKNRLQAVITNKPEKFSLAILKTLGVNHYFFKVVGGDGGFPKKPAPDALIEVLKEARVEPHEAVVVGDSAIDIETGRGAQVKTIAVTYGFAKLEEIEKSKPDFILNNLKELITCPFLQNP